jgi:hypothetical protein
MDSARILTAWDPAFGPNDEQLDDPHADMGDWMLATDFHGRYGGSPSFAHCHICEGALAHHSEVAAVAILPHDAPDTVLMRRVCRRCAPDEARARALAQTLLPYMMGGAA